jgi:hypothetical protein
MVDAGATCWAGSFAAKRKGPLAARNGWLPTWTTEDLKRFYHNLIALLCSIQTGLGGINAKSVSLLKWRKTAAPGDG